MDLKQNYWCWFGTQALGLPPISVVPTKNNDYRMLLGALHVSTYDTFAEAKAAANGISVLCEEVRDEQERAVSETFTVPADILKFEPGSREDYRLNADGSLSAVNPNPYNTLDLRPASGIGDVAGTTKGSGARYNGDKPQFELMPVRTFINMHQHRFDDLGHDGCNLYCSLLQLADFQEGETEIIYLAMQHGTSWAHDAVRVLEFGAQKYAEWNWAKGMSWQAIIGCALRHAKAVLDGEVLDAESGQSHLGHYLCNLVFLDHYVRMYKEGDDRPPAEFMK